MNQEEKQQRYDELCTNPGEETEEEMRERVNLFYALQGEPAERIDMTVLEFVVD